MPRRFGLRGRTAPAGDASVARRAPRALGGATVVISLYRGLLEREPTPSEVSDWVHALLSGKPLEEIIRDFVWSAERMALVNRRGRPLPPPTTDGPSITILDIGAQMLDDEDDPFRSLLNGGNCRVIGVEPLEGTHEARLRHDPGWTLLPYFAGDGSSRTFYETDFGGTSSLYEPNHDWIRDFAGLEEICTVATTSEVETVRLDDVVKEPVHLLKLDVQGAELDVLRGAERLLRSILVIHAEVEFFPIYRDQPLFDSIFSFLTENRFELFDLPHQTRYSYLSTSDSGERLLWSEAVFIPNRARLDALDEDDTRRLARIMHDNYGASGFASWLLDRLAAR
jgi:FkbM family methyltransferase